MQVNSRSRVAIAALLDIASHGTKKSVNLPDIAKRQKVSLSYLEQIFRNLRRGGFVLSFRGPGGGYRLAGCLATISVADIVEAVDSNSFTHLSREDDAQCAARESRISDMVWGRMYDRMRDYLRSVSLESLLQFDEASGYPARPSVAASPAFFAERTPVRPEVRPLAS